MSTTGKGAGTALKAHLRLRGDAGALPALEGAVIGVFLVLSVATITSLPSPEPKSPALTMRTDLNDLLLGWESLSTSDRFQHFLDKALARSLQGNTTDYDRWVQRALGQETTCRLWLDNGHTKRLLAGPTERTARQSVSASKLFHPTWAYSVAVPSIDTLSQQQPLPVEGFAVSQGALMKEAGVMVTAVVTTGDGVYQRGAITSLQDAPTAGLVLLGNAGRPSLSYEAGTVMDFTLALSSSTESLPSGTMLSVGLPMALREVGDTSGDQEGWTTILHTSSPKEGQSILVGLDKDLPERAILPFMIHGGQDPTQPTSFLPLRATLGNGSHGQATFILHTPMTATESDNAIRHGPYLNVPKPIAPGSTSTWGIVFTYPSTSLTGPDEHITRIDVTTPHHEPLFEDVVPYAGYPGTWTTSSPHHAYWEGNVTVPANGVASFLFNVTAVDQASTHEPPFALPLEFGRIGTAFETREFSRPNVYAFTIPPHGAEPGYEVPALDPLSNPTAEATLGSNGYARALRVEGNATYHVSTLPLVDSMQETLRLGLARSRLEIPKATARIGDQVEVDVDFTGLLDALGLIVQSDIDFPGMGGIWSHTATAHLTSWEVTLNIFDPAQPFLTFPAWERAGGVAFGRAGTLAMDSLGRGHAGGGTAWEVDPDAEVRSPTSAKLVFRPPADSLYGPHAVVAEARFTVSELGQSVTQTARMLGVLDVLPDWGQSVTALYWVSIECWQQDW